MLLSVRMRNLANLGEEECSVFFFFRQSIGSTGHTTAPTWYGTIPPPYHTQPYPHLPTMRRNGATQEVTRGEALALLHKRPTSVLGQGPAVVDKMIMKAAVHNHLFFPWMPAYRAWWTFTIVGAILTVFFGPFQVAFQKEPGSFNQAADYFELALNAIFFSDILVNFNLAVYKNEMLVFDRKEICREYLHGMFWVDFVGVFPFESIAVWLWSNRSPDVLLFSLLRLLRFVRLHRIAKLSDILQYDARVSLLWFTVLRNLAVVLVSTHMEACLMYFLARLHNFDDDTWLGPHLVHTMTGFQRYITALYWSIVTFCTVGYGDFSPGNALEQIWGSIFMLVNVVIAAWIIGSTTLLIVKGDEKTGEYRDSLQTLQQYGDMNMFDEAFMEQLQMQLRLEFNNREISDEQVLRHFPSAVRRKILRKLYLKPLVKTQLMKGVRQQFVDAFLASCKVEIFSPGEEIVERGAILSDLFLLVGGVAEIVSEHDLESTITGDGGVGSTRQLTHLDSFYEENFDTEQHLRRRKLEAGDFIGDISFFTESPQVDSVISLTVCKTLTISQTQYKLLSQDHPGSVGKILQNLLAKVEDMQLGLPKSLQILRAGSVFDIESGEVTADMNYESIDTLGEFGANHTVEERQKALTMVKDLVKMHMDKQLDDQTTRLLFAASRGDTDTISLMCDQGFDPNNVDYDNRSSLMVAAMVGNEKVVQLLLDYGVRVRRLSKHALD